MKKTFIVISLLLSIFLYFSKLQALAHSKNVAAPPDGKPILRVDTSKNELYMIVNGVLYKKYPVALGKLETPTPIGEWRVINKYKDWGGGFGARWIGLNVPWGRYGIHGTNKPSSIGTHASSGCIRMYNRDVKELYKWVHIGTPVFISGDPLEHFRRLALGDIGPDVQLVQQRLLGFGFYHGPCNGRFDISTERALKAFEKAKGIRIDGVVGLSDYRELGLLD